MNNWSEQEDRILIAAHENGTSYAIIATEYLPHRSLKAIKHRLRRIAGGAASRIRAPKSVPHDFNLAARLTNQACADKWAVSVDTVKSWRRETGIRSEIENGAQPLPVPIDFKSRASAMTRKELAVYYKRSVDTIDRWQKQTGVEIHRRFHKFSRRTNVRNIVHLSHATLTEAEKAAQFLRKFGPVFRCDKTGKHNPAGKMWNRGGHVLSDQDVIDRAAWLAERQAA